MINKSNEFEANKSIVKPIYKRLMIPLIAIFLLLVGTYSVFIMDIHKNNLDESNNQKLVLAEKETLETLREQTRMLSAVSNILACDEDMKKALKIKNRTLLLKTHRSTFAKLQRDHNITHFYFHLPDRVNLLRIHQPERYGDIINRFTALEAHGSHEESSGIELGPLGTFTLRLVRPVFDNTEIIGFLELGKEIEDILEHTHQKFGVELAVSINKIALKRENWESGMKMLGRETDWDRFPGDVLVYSSLESFPSELEDFVNESGHEHSNTERELEFDGKSWRITANPMKDVSGNEVGDIIIFNDISAINSSFDAQVTTISGTAAILLLILFSFLHYLLKRTDRTILSQQTKLVESEEHFRYLLERAGDSVFLYDSDGKFLLANKHICESLGYSHEELMSMNIRDIEGQESEGNLADRFNSSQETHSKTIEEKYQRKDGSSYPVEVRTGPLHWKDKDYLLVFARDISERKETEKEKAKSQKQTEQMNRLMTGREERVVEVKREVNSLLNELGRDQKYLKKQ